MIGLLKIPQIKDELLFDGEPVRVRRVRNAKRLILRVDAVTGEIKVTAPPHVRQSELQKFISEHASWLRNELQTHNAKPIVSDGTSIDYCDQSLKVQFLGEGRRQVFVQDGSLNVGGPVDQAGARLERWFKTQARDVLTDDAREYSDQLGVSYNRVSIGDMKSRWGSCSSAGVLRFNWRLLMAPEPVRRYVAAHEVSHLLEMNHSEAFWQHVASVMPGYMRHRRWLKEHGGALMQVRFR